MKWSEWDPWGKIESKYCIDWAWADSIQTDKLDMKETVYKTEQLIWLFKERLTEINTDATTIILCIVIILITKINIDL